MKYSRLPRVVTLLVAGIAVSILLVGCGPSETQIERAIERELPRLVGPAESYEVDVQGVRGTRRADRVSAVGRRVEPERSPVLDRVDVVLQNVEYDPGRGELTQVGQADAAVRVLNTDIAAYLEQNRNLENVSVTLSPPNRTVVQAQPRIPQLDIPPAATVSASGTLTGKGKNVNFNITEVRAAGLTLPDAAVRLLSQEINPIIDLSGMPIALQVVDLRVENNALITNLTGRYPPPP